MRICFLNVLLIMSINVVGQINFNVTDSIDEHTIFPDYEVKNQSGISIFTVSKSVGDNEQVLYSINKNSTPIEVVTTNRTVNKNKHCFINFQEKEDKIEPVKLICFVKEMDSLMIGAKLEWFKGNEKAPVDKFVGQMGERLIFDRVLSGIEKRQVESYLAIKYGITLDQQLPTSYYNSNGEKIWNANALESYKNEITGIGRDSLLNQLKSKNSASTDGLTISTNENLNKNAYLIWANDGKEMQFEQRKGNPKALKRHYAAQVSNQDFNTKVEFQKSDLQDLNIENESYFLAVCDTLKTDIFRTHFYKLSEKEGILFNEKVDWKSNTYTSFSIVKAPDFFIATSYEKPTCSNPEGGVLKIKIVGGTSPFKISLVEDGKIKEIQTTEADFYLFDQLKQGNYTIKVADKNGKSCEETLLIENAGFEDVLDFDDFYELPYGTSKWLDLNKSLGYEYEWQTPNNEFSNSSSIRLKEEGVYTLTVSNKEGCSSCKEVRVKVLPEDVIEKVEVSPNPTFDGKFYLRVQLKTEAGISISMYDLSGKLLDTIQQKDKNFYNVECYAPLTGVFVVNVVCGNDNKSIKVIRK